ncbi:MAG TPA: GNAT family N-acetyltransferase [Thermoanaerobaculia bacterium]|nr:GNAT family N-acetyltransferase [Thermoanaerobaculia bacterium]
MPSIRLLQPSDIPSWIDLRRQLWPDQTDLDEQGRTAIAADPPLIVFIAEEDESLIGFLELWLRSYAEGCDSSPVPYVEGWYVAPGSRRQGVGGALMQAAENWSRERGFTELGSDTEETNRLSRDAHAALGFAEVETLTVFRKVL